MIENIAYKVLPHNKQRHRMLRTGALSVMNNKILISVVLFLIFSTLPIHIVYGDNAKNGVLENIIIHLPVKMLNVAYLDDGGSIGFTFQGSNNEIFQFCFDGRMGSDTQGELYFGSDTPGEAKLIDKDSELSKQLVLILENQIFQNYKRSDIDKIMISENRMLNEEEILVKQIFSLLKQYEK